MNKLLTILFGLGVTAFVYYVVMVLVGCISSLCGAGYDYFCGTYCRIGLFLGIAIMLAFLFNIFRILQHSETNQ